jgi:hypothetical protein
MGLYRVRSVPKGVEVRHIAVFPLFMGFSVVLGGFAGLYLWAKTLQTASGLNYWMPLLICVGAGCAGLYLIFLRPALKRILFLADSKQLEVLDRGLVSRTMRTFTHRGLETLRVHEVDSDGYWYTPTIELADGNEFEIGFGCASADSAQSVIDRIVAMETLGRNKHG